MIDWIAEPAGVVWALAATCACAMVASRARSGRRRERLNRSLHELRRPLQALALSAPGSGHGQLECALEALAGLDREVNGGAPPARRPVETRALAEQAVARWRSVALRSGSRLELAWRAGSCVLECDSAAISRALDNLIANALEHGQGTVRVEGIRRPGRLRLHVADRGSGERRAPVRRRAAGDPRHGHGLRLVAQVAAEHGGRFAACRHERGTSAVIELPLPG